MANRPEGPVVCRGMSPTDSRKEAAFSPLPDSSADLGQLTPGFPMAPPSGEVDAMNRHQLSIFGARNGFLDLHSRKKDTQAGELKGIYIYLAECWCDRAEH